MRCAGIRGVGSGKVDARFPRYVLYLVRRLVRR